MAEQESDDEPKGPRSHEPYILFLSFYQTTTTLSFSLTPYDRMTYITHTHTSRTKKRVHHFIAFDQIRRPLSAPDVGFKRPSPMRNVMTPDTKSILSMVFFSVSKRSALNATDLFSSGVKSFNRLSRRQERENKTVALSFSNGNHDAQW